MNLEQMRRIAGLPDKETISHSTTKVLSEELQYFAKIAGVVLTEAKDEDKEDDKDDKKESKNPFAKKDDSDKKESKKDKDSDDDSDDEECDEDSDEECDEDEDSDEDLKESIDDDEGPRTKESKSKPASDEAKKKAAANKGAFWNVAKKPEKKEEPKEKKPAEKKEKSESDSNEPKKRGKAQNPESKTGRLRAWIKDHPGVKRSEAWQHALSTMGEKSDDNPTGITKAGFSTLYQMARSQSGLAKKREVKEGWIISHPSINTHVLHENREMNTYQWIHFLNENQDPMIFETEEDALRVANYIRDFKNQYYIIENTVL